jgi:rhodanese-related sulfurtransferase
MIRQMSVQDLARRLQGGERVHLLDVRQPWEHELVALPESQLIPLGELVQRLDEIQPEPGLPVVVYCHHGIRSLSGAALLQTAGFPEVYSLAGGIDAWSLLIDPRLPRY